MKRAVLFTIKLSLFAASVLMLYIADQALLVHEYVAATLNVVCALIPIREFLPRLV